MLNEILTARYGRPSAVKAGYYVEHRWKDDDEARRCILLMGERRSPSLLVGESHQLREVYGRYVGGFLLGNSIRVAAVVAREIYGLYRLDELRRQPEVQKALHLDPQVHYFMDAANVWFYGEKDGAMYVFDGETEELDRLGRVADAIEVLIHDWDEDVGT